MGGPPNTRSPSSAAILRALIDLLPFDVWACDRDGRYVAQGATSRARWGDRLGMLPDAAGIPEGVAARWRENNARALRGEIVRGETEYVQGGTRGVYFEIIAPVMEAGEVRGLVGVNLDITDRKVLEAERDALGGELRQTIAQLGRVKLELVARERLAALGELSAFVAHELRNPLAAILNALRALRRIAPLEGDAADLVRAAEEEGTRLGAVMTALLDFARPLAPRRAPVPVAWLVDAAERVAMRAARSDAPKVDVVRDVGPDLPPALVDAPLVEVALGNLVTNALQAMATRGGTLTLGAHREEQQGAPVIVLTVRDTGAGIADEVRDNVFDLFVTTRSIGFGLGLAVVKRIAEAHRGSVTMTSTKGQGTTFTLRLPAAPTSPST